LCSLNSDSASHRQVMSSTFVKLILLSANTASALNKTPGPSSRVKTILVCNNTNKCKNRKDILNDFESLRTMCRSFVLSCHRYKTCNLSLTGTSICCSDRCKDINCMTVVTFHTHAYGDAKLLYAGHYISSKPI
jgi:hypothetical protein